MVADSQTRDTGPLQENASERAKEHVRLSLAAFTYTNLTARRNPGPTLCQMEVGQSSQPLDRHLHPYTHSPIRTLLSSEKQALAITLTVLASSHTFFLYRLTRTPSEHLAATPFRSCRRIVQIGHLGI